MRLMRTAYEHRHGRRCCRCRRRHRRRTARCQNKGVSFDTFSANNNHRNHTHTHSATSIRVAYYDMLLPMFRWLRFGDAIVFERMAAKKHKQTYAGMIDLCYAETVGEHSRTNGSDVSEVKLNMGYIILFFFWLTRMWFSVRYRAIRI